MTVENIAEQKADDVVFKYIAEEGSRAIKEALNLFRHGLGYTTPIRAKEICSEANRWTEFVTDDEKMIEKYEFRLEYDEHNVPKVVQGAKPKTQWIGKEDDDGFGLQGI